VFFLKVLKNLHFNKIISEVSIKFSIKQLLIRFLLSVLRGFVRLKQSTRQVGWFFTRPFLNLVRFLFKWLGLPIYRLSFFLRRHFARLYNPAKNRFLFIFTNRYVFHAAIVTVAAVTSVINIQAGEVRAETFGSQSLLFGIVNNDTSVLVDEVSSARMDSLAPVIYSDIYSISAKDTEIDLLYEGQLAIVSESGAIATPTISESGESVAARGTTINYTVKEGDVLGAIAEKYGLNLNTILWANSLTYRSTIRPGQTLVVPPTDGVLYSVKNGDTLSSIAKKYNTTTDKIMAFNSLSSGGALQISQSLMLPDATPPTSAPVSYTAPASSIFTGTRGATAPAAATGSWIWPTDLCTITQYYNGWSHFGLDIDGDYINNIYTTRAGTVVRASWFDGYGNCVDVDHGGGYITRYGHLSKFFVSVGDVVGAGEALGKMGTTGRSTGTHLHFEIIQSGSRLNPLNFIRCK